MPPEIETLDQAIHLIKKKIKNVRITTIFIFTPAYAGFPVYDFISVAISPQFTRKYGLQIKLGKAYPKRHAHNWFDKSYLVRGEAPSTSYNNSLKGWNYLVQEDIQRFLGYSLFQVCPSEWPEPPQA
jgi:hypothetical protein